MIPRPNKQWKAAAIRSLRKLGAHGSVLLNAQVDSADVQVTLRAQLPAILITGATGTGKSVLALTIAERALQAGYEGVDWYSPKPVDMPAEVLEWLEDIRLSLDEKLNLNKCNLADQLARALRLQYPGRFNEYRYSEVLAEQQKGQGTRLIVIDEAMGPDAHQAAVLRLLQSGNPVVVVTQDCRDLPQSVVEQIMARTEAMILGKAFSMSEYSQDLRSVIGELRCTFDEYSEFAVVSRDTAEVRKVWIAKPAVNHTLKPRAIA